MFELPEDIYRLPEDTGPIPKMPNYPIDKEKIIIISLLILLLIIFSFFYFFSPPAQCPDLEIKCVAKDNVMVKNNIQATHAGNFSFNNNQVCVEVDGYGDLLGSSMQPSIFEENTFLWRNYTNYTKLKTGDILRYYRLPCNDTVALNDSQMNDTLAVIHRVNAVYDDYLLMIGDNLNEVESINRCQITGIVVGIIYT